MWLDRFRFSAFAVVSLAALLLWDASGLDLALAQLIGGPLGFPLRDNWFLAHALHATLRIGAWVFSVALCAAAIWPVGPWARLGLLRRVQLPATALLATGLVAALKSVSGTSCPWDLSDFGGVAQHLSHWLGWFESDGGRAHCFPAAHAASGFAFVGGYFAWRTELPRLARAWLVGGLVIGLVAGLSQQLRGAHFMSHTLWTAWICWVVAWLTDPLFANAKGVSASAFAQ